METPELTRKRRQPHMGHQAIADRLKAQPGQWATVAWYGGPKSAQSTARRIRQGLLAAYAPAGDFDARPQAEGGRHAVRAVYLGDGEGDG